MVSSLFRARSEASEHYLDHGDADPGFPALRLAFMVLAQPPMPPQPPVRSLDHPAVVQHHEPYGRQRPRDDLQQPVADDQAPLRQPVVPPTRRADKLD